MRGSRDVNTVNVTRILQCVGGCVDAANAHLYLPPLSAGTLANWRSKGEGPRWGLYGIHVIYRLADMEEWLDANVEGRGRRAEYFPVSRVVPEQVARWLQASTSPRFRGKPVKLILKALERMRADGTGPAWLRLARHVTYFIPDLRLWEASEGITSTMTMLPAVAGVDIVSRTPLADELERRGAEPEHVRRCRWAETIVAQTRKRTRKVKE
jgi:hypothetical protein